MSLGRLNGCLIAINCGLGSMPHVFGGIEQISNEEIRVVVTSGDS